MKLLALETSTETLSIALGEAGADGRMRLVAGHEGPGGAQSSATLLPAVAGLLDQAGWRLQDLSAIAFGEGPGSFTGLRTACSVAQGLALGADLPVLPIDTLMAVAEQGWAQHNPTDTLTGTLDGGPGQPAVLAAMDARMGEVYFGLYTRLPRPPAEPPAWAHGPVQLAAPEDIALAAAVLLAGNARAAHAARLPAALLALPHVDC
ncbi:MAG: tRNA (adenosine(37)-N6)-threonylcarbamoyltransferase complex dimerization subunit type 1 TsaB, partial [Comamonas sp.]